MYIHRWDGLLLSIIFQYLRKHCDMSNVMGRLPGFYFLKGKRYKRDNQKPLVKEIKSGQRHYQKDKNETTKRQTTAPKILFLMLNIMTIYLEIYITNTFLINSI